MSVYGRGYYSNGRPHWDDQFRETEWEKRERQRKRRETEAAKVVAPDPLPTPARPASEGE